MSWMKNNKQKKKKRHNSSGLNEIPPLTLRVASSRAGYFAHTIAPQTDMAHWKQECREPVLSLFPEEQDFPHSVDQWALQRREGVMGRGMNMSEEGIEGPGVTVERGWLEGRSCCEGGIDGGVFMNLNYYLWQRKRDKLESWRGGSEGEAWRGGCKEGGS